MATDEARWPSDARPYSRVLCQLANTLGRYAICPELFRQQLRQAMERVATATRPPEKRIVFMKAWNEWAEGNYVETDQKWGHAYLDVINEEVAQGD